MLETKRLIEMLKDWYEGEVDRRSEYSMGMSLEERLGLATIIKILRKKDNGKTRQG